MKSNFKAISMIYLIVLGLWLVAISLVDTTTEVPHVMCHGKNELNICRDNQPELLIDAKKSRQSSLYILLVSFGDIFLFHEIRKGEMIISFSVLGDIGIWAGQPLYFRFFSYSVCHACFSEYSFA